MRATPATHSGNAALRSLKMDKNLIAYQFEKSWPADWTNRKESTLLVAIPYIKKTKKLKT